MNHEELTIAEILDSNGHRNIATIYRDAPVREAARRMQERNVGSLLVLTYDQGLTGIITERDCLKHLAKAYRDECGAAPVKVVMTADVVAVSPDQDLYEALAVMSKKRLRHLPVMKEGAVVGVVSQGDLVKALLESQLTTIDDLSRHFHNVYPGVKLAGPVPLGATSSGIAIS